MASTVVGTFIDGIIDTILLSLCLSSVVKTRLILQRGNESSQTSSLNHHVSHVRLGYKSWILFARLASLEDAG